MQTKGNLGSKESMTWKNKLFRKDSFNIEERLTEEWKKSGIEHCRLKKEHHNSILEFFFFLVKTSVRLCLLKLSFWKFL